MTEKTTSLRGLADLLGVSDTAVRKALKVGVFSDGSIRRDDSGNPSVVNVTLAVTEWRRSGRQVRTDELPPVPSAARLDDERQASDDLHAQLAALLTQVRTLRQGMAATSSEPGDEDPAGAGPRDGADGSLTLVQAQTETQIQRGRMLRMEADLQEGALVKADQAARAAFEFSRTLREAILNVPPRIAAELAAESNAARVHVRLETALREALASVASILDASGAPPHASPATE